MKCPYCGGKAIKKPNGQWYCPKCDDGIPVIKEKNGKKV